MLLVATVVPFLGTIGYALLMSLIILFGLTRHIEVLKSKPFHYMTLFIFIEFFYSIFGQGIGFTMIIFHSLYYFVAIIICFNLEKLSSKQISFLLYLILGLFTFTFVVTFYALMTDPMAIRQYAYGGEDALSDSPQAFGVYSYGFGEALAIILPTLMAFVLSTKNILLKLLCFLVVAGGLITQLLASLTTSVLLSFVFCSMVVLSGLLSIQNKLYRIVLFIIIGLFVVIIVRSISLDDNLTFLVKMEDVSQSYSTGESVGQVEDRSSLYVQSIKVCIRNPILGLGECPDEFGTYNENTVSLHTTIFDFWGFYGLFLIWFIVSWKKTIEKTYSLLCKGTKKYYKWTFFSLFSLLLLKGPVTIGLNFLFSTVLFGIVCMAAYHRQPQLINKNVQKCSDMGR